MEKLSFAQQICVKKAGLALQRCAALAPGARIGIAVSGGVDSFTLLKVMRLRQKIIPFSVEIMALHLNPGFDGKNHTALLPWLAREGIAGHIEKTDYGPRAHSGENRKKSACFFCAMLRRKRLFALCAQYGLTHLAFGHNADDLLDTFLLNFCGTGRVEGMDIGVPFFCGKLLVIRPLLLVEKKYIKQAARQWRLPVWANACPSAGKTARAKAQLVTSQICQVMPQARRSMLNALVRWQLGKNWNPKEEGYE